MIRRAEAIRTPRKSIAVSVRTEDYWWCCSLSRSVATAGKKLLGKSTRWWPVNKMYKPCMMKPYCVCVDTHMYQQHADNECAYTYIHV